MKRLLSLMLLGLSFSVLAEETKKETKKERKARLEEIYKITEAEIAARLGKDTPEEAKRRRAEDAKLTKKERKKKKQEERYQKEEAKLNARLEQQRMAENYARQEALAGQRDFRTSCETVWSAAVSGFVQTGYSLPASDRQSGILNLRWNGQGVSFPSGAVQSYTHYRLLPLQTLVEFRVTDGTFVIFPRNDGGCHATLHLNFVVYDSGWAMNGWFIAESNHQLEKEILESIAKAVEQPPLLPPLLLPQKETTMGIDQQKGDDDGIRRP